MTIRLRRYTDLEQAAVPLIAVYAKVREPLLHLPNYSVPTFADRLDRHGREPGFVAVIAFDNDGNPVGYAYGNTVEAGDRWWTRAEGVDPKHTVEPVLALKEIGVVVPHRGTGLARRIHDRLLARRTDTAVALMVNPTAGDGKVQQVYEGWGYEAIGSAQPSPDSPPLVMMFRPTR
ncbi:GNAT family N-acetyltransferase [Streptomyces sp. NBC_01244]|uniref:GNAT family N-acetyltransferase n=1 Tax=Streptomyces sp. NBC_01244 TaxID=2903797 RepID=UPI002E0FA433|nr:GNAT family N-acetyltransferase [Streptomyces sp. NBC_01244]